MQSFFQLLKLIRFPNLAIIAITQFMVAWFLIEENTFLLVATNLNLILLIISTLFIAAAGYLINDYYDIKIDYVNKPDRVVVGKFIKRRHVLIIHSIFNFVGIALGFFISWWVGGLHLFAASALWLYSNLLKRLPLWGNITVSLLTGLSVFSIYLLYFQSLEIILMYAVFAFFISLIREIVKDLEDIKGDEKFGCKTLPIVVGSNKTKQVVYGLTMLFISIAVFLTNGWSIFYPFIVTLSSILTFLCVKIYVADKKQDYSSISNLAKVIMVVGISSMILI